MIEQTYTMAGVSVFEGETTYRFANNPNRGKVLERNGHSDVRFWTLPRPMVLADAVKWLQAQGVVALLPVGQRKGINGGSRRAAEEAVREQQDAHVVAHQEWLVAEAARKADFVKRMAEARARKRAAQAEAVAA